MDEMENLMGTNEKKVRTADRSWSAPALWRFRLPTTFKPPQGWRTPRRCAPRRRPRCILRQSGPAGQGERKRNERPTPESRETNSPESPALFTTAFGSPEIIPEKIGLAIESFVLTFTSFDSKFDHVLKGEAKRTEFEQRGFELFMTEYDPCREPFRADCFHRHGDPLFQSQTFANNGLDFDPTTFCRICDKRLCVHRDLGRAKVTGRGSDAGKFATASPRPRYATWPRPRPTCTTDASRRWKKSSRITAPA